jgi:hypothetical protein
MKRARYQNGSVVLDRRRNIWYFRWSEGSTRRAARLGTLIELPTKAKAWRKAEGYRLTANSEPNLKPVVTFEAGRLVRYRQADLLAFLDSHHVS